MIGIELPIAGIADVFTSWSFWIGVGVLAGIYGFLAMGLQLNVGYTGVINFGQVGFMAVGAYSAVILYVDVGLPFLLSLLLSLLITMGAGLLIGLPAVRLRADYLAIATIAFAEVIRITARNARSLTGGNQGTLNLELENDRSFTQPWDDVADWMSETLFDPIGLSGTDFVDLPLLVFSWIVLGAVAFGMHRLIRTPWGRVMRAVREDEDAASALGKNAFAYKLQSLAIAAGLGAVAGWFFLFSLGQVNQDSFMPLVTFLAYGVLVLGGLASFWGVLLGAALFWFVLEGLREVLSELDLGLASDEIAAVRFIVAGLILILLMAFRPQGAMGKKEEMVLGE